MLALWACRCTGVRCVASTFCSSRGPCCSAVGTQVLITGARTSTLLTRLPFLPAADAYVAENGGRIFYPDTTLPTAMPLAEDTKWRKTHNATGARACWCWQAATAPASKQPQGHAGPC